MFSMCFEAILSCINLVFTYPHFQLTTATTITTTKSSAATPPTTGPMYLFVLSLSSFLIGDDGASI